MDKNLKILFLGDFQSPNTKSWIEGLVEVGAEVIKASARSDGSGEIHPIGPIGFPARLRILLGVNDVKKLIEKYEPDVIIGYRVTSYGYLAAKTGFHPIVVAAQNEQITFLRKPSWWRQKMLSHFASQAIKKADLLHAWSDNVSDGLKKFGADEKNILVMHRGINNEIFAPHDYSFNPEKPKIISTRSLFTEYKIDKLIEAFKTITESFPEASLTIIGDGPERKNLENLAGSLNLSKNIKFTGRLKTAEISMILAESDIYISLIDTEGLSSSLLEACACGTIPIAADIPASRAVIQNNENGILINDLSPKETGEIICQAIKDDNLRAKCRKNNPEIISEKFSRKNNLKKFLDKYQELIEEKSK
jgi:glycosyltransferase involved in cell wall biosynthesis